MVTGWVLDVAAESEGVAVWFRAASGETRLLRAPFCPSFVLSGRGVRGEKVVAAARRWGCAAVPRVGIDFFSGKTVPAWTLSVPSPFALRETVRKAEGAFGAEALHDADIAPEQQFAYATGLYPLARAEVDLAPDGTLLGSRVLDSPWDADAPLPVLAEARLATAGTGHPAHGRVRPLEIEADGRTHVLLWEDGEGLLRELSRLLNAHDPDLLVTEYGDDYILPRLLALAARLGTPLRLGREDRRAGGDAGAVRLSR